MMGRSATLAQRIILCAVLFAMLLGCGVPDDRSSADPISAREQEASEDASSTSVVETANDTAGLEDDIQVRRIAATVGGVAYDVTLEQNETADAFVALLPLTSEMSELNGNEKYVYLGETLPSTPQQVGHVEAGDLMLFGEDCLVLFYESFDTPYRYTRIGRLDDPSGIAEAVGTGTALVEFGTRGGKAQ